MTRWAKSGSSQKHKKLPENATPWEELSKCVNKSKSGDNRINKVSESIASSEINMNFACKNLDETSSQKKFNKNKRVEKNSTNTESGGSIFNKPLVKECDKGTSQSRCTIIRKGLSKRQVQRLRWKEKQKRKMNNSSNLLDLKNQGDNEKNTSLGKKESSEVILSKSNEMLEKESKSETNREKTSNSHLYENLSEQGNANITDKQSSEKAQLKKKEIYRQKLLKKRTEQGIALLSPKTERKLYMLKKSLRKKGCSPEQIKDIIRKERRKAELDLRKTVITKICFNCRRPGHLLVDCPKPSKRSDQETGICFKCGSIEHTSKSCTKEVIGFPFATCFICKASGHISRDCPKNNHGIYPKGGKCNLCDSINHLRKDCPTIKKTEENEPLFTLHTINEGASIDDEITEDKIVIEKKKLKKTKIVTF